MANLDISIPTTQLPDGTKIPLLAYGTGTAWYKSGKGSLDKELIEATKTAIKLGYTHLDGAEVYDTEPELGAAIKESGVTREKLFVTTKVIKNIADIPGAIENSLKRLGLTYVDLYLIHSPFFANGDKRILQKAWAEMEQVQASGKAKLIGVSNFMRPELDAILETAKVRPAVNQIEFNPYLQHGDLIAFHKNQNIRLAAYGPQIPVVKAKGGPLDGYLEALAKKYAVNPGEILLRWCVDQNIIAVTTSSKEQRMSDMLRIATFKLTPREMEEITDIGNSHHFRAFWLDKFDKNDRS